MIPFDETTNKNLQEWLEGDCDEITKNEIRRLLREDPKKIVDIFYKKLSFGTAGLRGLMGVGSNRLNIYTIRTTTQGLANYLHKMAGHGVPSVVIGYDSRHHSKTFAEETAKVLAGNQIRAYLFENISPTPLVSFACRYKKCRAAIMITASHNPPEYNGYKVYWAYGGQVVAPHDQGIMDQVNQIKSLKEVKLAKENDPLIAIVGKEIIAAYLDAVSSLQLYPEQNQSQGEGLSIVYTSLHGTGIYLAPQTLAMWGFTNVSYVDEQVIPDGDFPTAKHPNPEEKSALKLGIARLGEISGDVLFATDPDADRIGVVVNHHGDMVTLNGNEIAYLCMEHICKALKDQNRLPENAAFVKSIVTSELVAEIARQYQCQCFDVLTGFKYIAEWIEKNRDFQFIFGCEESYGYLYGTFCRDKDAILSCALIAEAALLAKRNHQTLVDQLHEIYRKYGVHRNQVLSVTFPETKEGRDQMKKALETLRLSPPKMILGTPVVLMEDFLLSVKIQFPSEKREKIPLPPTDMLRFHLKDRTILTVRPSGTEPKVKLYVETIFEKTKNLEEAIEHCDTFCKEYLQTMKMLITCFG